MKNSLPVRQLEPDRLLADVANQPSFFPDGESFFLQRLLFRPTAGKNDGTIVSPCSLRDEMNRSPDKNVPLPCSFESNCQQLNIIFCFLIIHNFHNELKKWMA